MEKLKEQQLALKNYIGHDVGCSYKDSSKDSERIKAIFTGMSRGEGIETTYKRHRKGCSGDYIGFDRRNNINDLEFKLHLHPMSDIDKYLNKLSEWLYNQEPESFNDVWGAKKWIKATIHLKGYEIQSLPYKIVNKLIEWHFDVFFLIKEGLAIDINTI